LATLTQIVDETFPESDTKHSDIRSLALSIIERLLDAKTISEILQCLDDVSTFNTLALEALGGSRFSSLSQSPSPARSTSPQSLSEEDAIKLQDVDRALCDLGRVSPSPRLLSTSTHFTFTVSQHPERLVISWSVRTDLRTIMALILIHSL
jgi:hypothetical protein